MLGPARGASLEHAGEWSCSGLIAYIQCSYELDPVQTIRRVRMLIIHSFVYLIEMSGMVNMV